jgi:hypothetical protein
MKSFTAFLNEEESITIWYHGSNNRNLSVNNIEIRDDSERMFYGDAFYVTDDISLARLDGKYIYKVQFSGNFYKTSSLESIKSFGTFKNFLSIAFKEIKRDILDKVMGNPSYWQIKLKLSNKLIKEVLVHGDSHTLAEKYIEANLDELFDRYADNQMGLRDAFEEMGYDGITDGIYTAIYNPETCVKSIEKIQL